MPSSCGFNKSFIIIEYLHDIHRYLHDIHCLFDMRNDCRAVKYNVIVWPHPLQFQRRPASVDECLCSGH